MTLSTRALYTSSTGDTWALYRNRNGDVVVLHEPNHASGGKSSEIDLSTFLAQRNTGPEHDALRQLIGELIESNNVEAEYDDHD
jgi:hypothetical protein